LSSGLDAVGRSVVEERARTLADDYASNSWLIRRHAEGLADQGARRQPRFEAISFNWVLGHIVQHRILALQALGVRPMWSDVLSAHYGGDPAGMQDPGRGLPLDELLRDLAAAASDLEAALSQVTSTELDQIVETPMGKKTRFEWISGLTWHETYHVGQLGLLRSLALAEEGSA
jgi:hypothetical protein